LLGQVGWFESAAADLADDCEKVIRRAVRDFDDGTSGSGDIKVAGGKYGEDGAQNGRIPSMVIDQASDDPVAQAMRRLVGRVIVMRAAMLGAQADAAFLRGLDAETAKRLVSEQKVAPGAGYCNDCGRWVVGGRDDRLRSGMCDACRKRRERAGAIETPEITARLVESRPLQYSELPRVAKLTIRRCVATKWSAGVDYVCTLPTHGDELAHEWAQAPA
jgi:hypothetical protein